MTADKTILLVEDNPDDVELNLRALRKYNVTNHVVVVGDGAEALDYLFGMGTYQGRDTGDLPTIVLLDLKLPKIDGLKVLQQLRSDPRTRLIPVIVLTSSSQEKDVIESYRLGCNSYIRKPVDFAEFLEAVRQLGLYWLLINESPPKPRAV